MEVIKKQLNKEITYLRFLNETLQAKVLKKEICDEFTRKIFDYLEDKPLFDSQVFCALIYEFIFRCKLYKSLVMTAETNVYDKIRLDAGHIANKLSLFLTSHSVRFALSSFNPNCFSVSLEEKLEHLLFENDDFDRNTGIYKLQSRKNKNKWISWKDPRVEIIIPEQRGNIGIVPYIDLEFYLPPLKTEQKLEVLHFTICALNYLSQKDEPVETFSNPAISSTVLVSKPEHLKVVSDNLIRVRDSVILNAIRDKESFGDSLDFDESLPDVARILKAQNQDLRIEKQWLNDDPPICISSDIKANEPEDEKDFAMRKKVIALMLLTFGRLDLPEDIINERVIEFFHGITGGSRKNLSNKIANPTAHKGTTRSIKLLCDDLNFVRDQLGKLGLSNNIVSAINEINFLIEELKEKDN